MRYLSLFSGIEAASVAWMPLGWKCLGVAEIEPFPNVVLGTRFPDTPKVWLSMDLERAKELSGYEG